MSNETDVDKGARDNDPCCILRKIPADSTNAFYGTIEGGRFFMAQKLTQRGFREGYKRFVENLAECFKYSDGTVGYMFSDTVKCSWKNGRIDRAIGGAPVKFIPDSSFMNLLSPVSDGPKFWIPKEELKELEERAKKYRPLDWLPAPKGNMI